MLLFVINAIDMMYKLCVFSEFLSIMNELINYLGYCSLGYILVVLARGLWYMIQTYFLPHYGFCKKLKEYGEWAVVTGATDGIGKEYAKQLAADGLNIVLISRSKNKLEAVSSEIKESFNVKVKTITYDFSNTSDYEEIQEVLKDLDIGILINNVGMAYGSIAPFHELDIERIVQIMNVNMISDARMTHIVQKGMVERKRGAIVHISSGSIYLVAASMNVYPACKLFMKKFTEALMLEYQGVVDHQLVSPMYVESNMSKMKAGFTIPTAKHYVSYALRTIGVAGDTCGYPTHELLYVILNNIPVFVSQWGYMLHRSLRRLKSS